MINYGYFRHRFDAHLNPKLNNLVDEIGVAAYAYYYTLLEIYGSHYARKKENNEVLITARELSNTWRKRVDSCDLVMTKLQLSGLLVYTKSQNTYSVNIPNFLKYYGSYKKTEALTPSNKRKENKIKEKEIKVYIPKNNDTKLNYTPDEFILDWNRELVPFGLPYCKGLSGNQNISFISILKAFSREDFFEVIETIKHSDFLKSKNFVSAPWVLNEDNFSKILNGTYRNDPEAPEEKKYIPKFEEIDAEPIELTQAHMDHIRSILEKGQKRG